jgi:hypothetical protein
MGKSEGHGTLMIAEMSKALTRCTTVGVAKALTDSAVGRWRMLAMSAITTNWIPISAAPEDPTMT